MAKRSMRQNCCLFSLGPYLRFVDASTAAIARRTAAILRADSTVSLQQQLSTVINL